MSLDESQEGDGLDTKLARLLHRRGRVELGVLRSLLNETRLVRTEGGATLAELSHSLGVGTATVLKDLTQITARAYYLPAGSDDLLLEIEGDRVSLFTPAAFDRPVRLSMPEAVCLGLALRGRLTQLLSSTPYPSAALNAS